MEAPAKTIRMVDGIDSQTSLEPFNWCFADLPADLADQINGSVCYGEKSGGNYCAHGRRSSATSDAGRNSPTSESFSLAAPAYIQGRHRRIAQAISEAIADAESQGTA